MNFTPDGYMASPSGGTGRVTGKMSPSVGTADPASVAPAMPAAEVFKNSRRELIICFTIRLSPCDHCILKQGTQFFRPGRARRELGYPVLRQRPFHQFRN